MAGCFHVLLILLSYGQKKQYPVDNPNISLSNRSLISLNIQGRFVFPSWFYPVCFAPPSYLYTKLLRNKQGDNTEQTPD